MTLYLCVSVRVTLDFVLVCFSKGNTVDFVLVCFSKGNTILHEVITLGSGGLEVIDKLIRLVSNTRSIFDLVPTISYLLELV